MVNVRLSAASGLIKQFLHFPADAVFGLFHQMAVDAGGGRHAGMAQAVADADAVDAAKKQQAGHRMPESMGVEVRQIMPFLKPGQPVSQL